MQASYAGPLASYNSLTDEHLAEYFSNPRNFKHLRRMGLITRDGRIVDEGIIRVNNARKEHKARSKGVLANSIINRAVEIERKRRGELKKKLELLEKYEIVEKVKSQKHHPAGIQEFNPYRTIPPLPPRLSTTLDMHFDKLSLSADQISDMRHLVGKISRDRSIPPHRAKSPYEEELSSRYSTPVPRPPSTPRPSTAMNVKGRRSTIRNRPSTAPAGMGMRPRQSAQRQISTRSRPVHSNVSITLRFISTGLHIDKYAMESQLSDVMVLQQHCGGNTVTLYKGKLKPKDIFTFVSKRHVGMPYGLTIYLDGMMDSRVSACCEYRHQCGMLLGSKTAHFKLVKVEGGKPCYRCEVELNKRYLKEKQDKEIERVLGETSSVQELVSHEENFNRDEDPPVIDESSVHSISQTSQGGVEQLDEPSDLQEKVSLASHSNVSVGSLKSYSSRVSVASSKSSIHSHQSVASRTSSRSNKSSKTSLHDRKNSSRSSSSHSLVKVDSSEVPIASNNSLTPSGSAVLSSEIGVEPEIADADTEYNYDDENFEELEDLDPERVQTDPELSKEREMSDSDPIDIANAEYDQGDGESKEEENLHQIGKQPDETDTVPSKEKHLSNTKPDEATDMDVEYNYANDKIEETNPEALMTDESKQQPEGHEYLEDASQVSTEEPPAGTEPAEERVEDVESTAPVSSDSVEKESSVMIENKNTNNAERHQTKDLTDSDINTEETIPRQQSGSNHADTHHIVDPESDPNKPKDNDTENITVTQEPANKELPRLISIEVPQVSEAGLEDVKDGVSEDQSQAPAISGDTQEAQIDSKDKGDMSKSQQGLTPQGILLSTSGRKSRGHSVSFEGTSEIAKEDEQPAKDLLASLTIEEAKKVLQKSPSASSLGSLLSEKENSALGSSLDLSGSEDEYIPDLEQKISDLIDGDSGEAEEKAEVQENTESVATVRENEKEHIDSNESEENAISQPVYKSGKETGGVEEEAELQENAETAEVPECEKESIEQPSDEVSGEDQDDLDKTPTNSQTDNNIAKKVAELSDQEETTGDQSIPATNSQTEMAKEGAQIPDQESIIEEQGAPPTKSQTEASMEEAEIPSQEANIEDKVTNSQIETVMEAEVREEVASVDITIQASAEGEMKDEQQQGEPELTSVPVPDANDTDSVKSGLSSSSKSSLTSVSSQGSRRS